MKVVFRVDASLDIGTGHVMRCITLAEALKKNKVSVEFICREHIGNMINFIQRKGFNVHVLALESSFDTSVKDQSLRHAEWLGATQEQDAKASKAFLRKIQPEWLIIDHYGIDETWQTAVQGTYKKLMVIDDLADRKHQCNLLLDQTFGRLSSDYEGLVPENCQLLLGSQYALLRPEFSQWREYSLKRRDKFEFKTLLISMGGVDKDNITTQILEQLQNCELPQQLKIIVVMGAGAPNLSIVQEMAKSLSYQVEVKVNVENMAELMSNSDLAIGASGATTWERCCLGLPSIQLIMAENQKVAASLLDAAGAIKLVNSICQLSYSLLNIQAWPTRISDVSRAICDGAGAQAVVDNLVRRN